MQSQNVVVVGAGIGGLVAALELASAGVEVLVVESAPGPGGKLRQVHIDGATLDAGPTVFTMRGVFEDLFEAVGERLEDHLRLHRAEILARHAWSPEECLDLYADVQRTTDAIGAFAGAAEARSYLAFCERARLIYQTLEGPFMQASRPSPLSLTRRIGAHDLRGLTRISPFGSMWSALGRYFLDPRLRQLFGRYATYCGSSPFMAPATLMLVAHAEQSGVWMLEGGMHRLAVVLADLATRRGVRIRYGTTVSSLQTRGGRATGVCLADSETVAAAAVVFNGDVAALAAGLLGKAAAPAVPALDGSRRSLSALTWNILGTAQGFPLLRHNVFFSGDYGAEFDALFDGRRLPADPTVYVCAQDRGDHDVPAPRRAERLLCLVNAPATGDTGGPDAADIDRCEERAFERLSRNGLRLYRDAGNCVRTTPADFARMFPGTGGALYGSSSHGWMASFARPGARSRLAGLYLAGGSTHPGPGVPMAALSGRQAAASVMADLCESMRRSRA